MTDRFSNVYDGKLRAESYDRLEFSGTYYLAYRDLPSLISKHVRGKRALDFGCGTGRSTRFLKKLGFNVVGVDIADQMLDLAKRHDPEGDYRLVGDGNLDGLDAGAFDLVLSVFTFDNIPTMEKKVQLLQSLRRMLDPNGRIVNLVSSPEIYLHEWATFSTKDFPQNRKAKSGEKVSIVMLDVEDDRPVEDIIWMEPDYRETFSRAGLEVIDVHKPLATKNEPYEWKSETSISPWAIYILRSGT